MNIYYVYAYLRKDGTPYYIGKGKGRRLFSSTRRIPKPSKDKIIIMENNLTEVGALALERFYIRWYGRKDLNTGILRNRTEGGDGASGLIVSAETRTKISKSLAGRKFSAEHREKIGLSNKGNKQHSNFMKLLNISRKGKPISDEHRRRISEARKGKKFPRVKI